MSINYCLFTTYKIDDDSLNSPHRQPQTIQQSVQMQEEESGCFSQSVYSCSFSQVVEADNNGPQVIDEAYRQIVTEHTFISFYPIDKHQLYRCFNSKATVIGKITAVIRLNSYVKRIRNCRQSQHQMIGSINLIHQIRKVLRPNCSAQLKYQILTLVSTIIKSINPSYPLYTLLACRYPQLLNECLTSMLDFTNSKLNRAGILCLHRLLKYHSSQAIEYAIEQKVIVRIFQLIQSKRIQRIKIWFSEIIQYILDICLDKTSPFILTLGQLQVVTRFIIILCKRKRSSASAKHLISRITTFYTPDNQEYIQLYRDITFQLVKAAAIFPRTFLKLVDSVSRCIALPKDIVEDVVATVDLVLDNQEKSNQSLVSVILARVFQYQPLMGQQSWDLHKQCCMKLLRRRVMEKGEFLVSRIDLYRAMIQNKDEFLAEYTDFISIIPRLIEIESSRTNFVRIYCQEKIPKEWIVDLFRWMDEHLDSGKQNQIRLQLKMLVLRMNRIALKLIEARYGIVQRIR